MTYILFLFFLLTTIPYIITIYINKENKKNISFENYDSGTKITIKDTKTGKLYTTVLDGTEFMDVYSSDVPSLTKPNQIVRVDFVANVDDCFGITTPTGYNKNVEFTFNAYFNHQSTNDTATKDNATKNTVMNDNGSVPTGSPITTMLFTLSAVIAGGALFLSYRKKFEK